MKNKGFTLIELLAVIVVLAIVALITVPVILNVIEKVRKESYRDSVYGIIESGKIYLASHIDSISEKDEIEFTCDGDKCTSTKGELSFKGNAPKSGSIYISGNGLIEIESLYNGKYYANGSNEEGIEITNDSPMTRSELEEAILAMQEKYDREITSLKQENEQLVSKNNSQDSEINSLKSENNAIKNTTTSIDEVYPVGSIYLTLNNVNPATLFPNTEWEAYGSSDTYLRLGGNGNGGSNSVSYKPDGTVNYHTLTVDEIPSHNHTFYGNKTETEYNGDHSHSTNAHVYGDFSGYSYNTPNGSGYYYGKNYVGTNTAGGHTHNFIPTGSISNIGGGAGHSHGFTGTKVTISITPKYVQVYAWKRKV